MATILDPLAQAEELKKRLQNEPANPRREPRAEDGDGNENRSRVYGEADMAYQSVADAIEALADEHLKNALHEAVVFDKPRPQQSAGLLKSKLAHFVELLSLIQALGKKPAADSKQLEELTKRVEGLVEEKKQLDGDLKQAQQEVGKERTRANNLDHDLQEVKKVQDQANKDLADLRREKEEATRKLDEIEKRRKSAVDNATAISNQLTAANDKAAKLEEHQRDHQKSLENFVSQLVSWLPRFPANPSMEATKSMLQSIKTAVEAKDFSKADLLLYPFMVALVTGVQDVGKDLEQQTKLTTDLKKEVDGFRAREKVIADGETTLHNSCTTVQRVCGRLVGLVALLETAEETAFTDQARALQTRLGSGKDLGPALNDFVDWLDRLGTAVNQKLMDDHAGQVTAAADLTTREQALTAVRQRAEELVGELDRRILQLPTGVAKAPFRTRLDSVQTQLGQLGQLAEALRALIILADDVARAGAVPAPREEESMLTMWRFNTWPKVAWGAILFGIGAVSIVLIIWLIGMSQSTGSSGGSGTQPGAYKYESIFKD